nr:carboxypeptidase regulatory-like domain-containing protein [uncultured Actinotalea sp.]
MVPAVADGVRVSGLVTGVQSEGFTVRIAPAGQVLDPDAVVLGGSGTRDVEQASTRSGGAAADGPEVRSAVWDPSSAQLRDAVVRGATAPAAAGPATKLAAAARPAVRTEIVDEVRTTTSLADGTWAFAGLRPTATYLVTLAKAGFQTQRFVLTGAQAAAAPLEVEMVAGAGRLSGLVTGPTGPAGGVDVTITDGTTTVTTSTATEGPVGEWSVDGLSTPSTYLITAAGAGLGAQSALVTLGAGGVRTVDLSLQTGVASLAGVVTGPDALGVVGGLGGMTVTATDGTTTRTASTATSGQVGAFVLADLPVPATYSVTVSGPGYAATTSEVTLTTGSAAARLDVALSAATGTVQGTVQDGTGAGLGGAGLTLTDGENTYKTMSTSDETGSFRISGVTPGTYVLSAEVFGYVTGFAPVTVAAGGVATADLELADVPGDGLLATSFIRGRVSDARTNGQITCPGLDTDAGETCEVTVTLRAADASGAVRTVTVTSAPDLEYQIPAADDPAGGLLPGLYALSVSAPGYEPGTVQVEVPMDQVVRAAQVALFPSPSLVGTVLARVGTVPAGTCVLAVPAGQDLGAVGPCTLGVDADGAPTCEVAGDARCAGTGVNGSYEMSRLRSGDYQVLVRPGDGEYLAVPPVTISLTPGDVRRYDVTLDRLGRVALTVLADVGTSALQPAPAATITPVRVTGGVDAPLPSVTADDAGRRLVTGLTAGTYRFDVTWTEAGVGTLEASTPLITVGTNQELSTQVALTRTRAAFQGRVVTLLAPGQEAPASGVTVQITGVTRYEGLTPVRATATVTTSATGTFSVVPTPTVAPNTAVLPLAADELSVQVTDPLLPVARFETLTVNETTVTALEGAPLVVEPVGRAYVPTVRLVGNDLTGFDVEDVVLTVESTPPGVTGLQLTAVDDGSGTGGGVVRWRDLAQPSGGVPEGTLARPGDYRVTATLGGFETRTFPFTVPLADQPATPVAIELRRFGELEIQVVWDQVVDAGPFLPPTTTRRAVPDPVVTLFRPASGNVTLTAAPGDNTVDFGELAPGTYQVRVQAPGYRFVTRDVVVPAGLADPVPFVVEKLGAITGTVQVRSADGTLRSLAGVPVTATDAAGNTFTATSGDTGRYDITGTAVRQGLAAGPWTVTAVVTGYVMTQPTGFSVTVVEGTVAPSSVDVVLSAVPVDLRVFVFDPETDEGIDGLTVLLRRTGQAARTAEPCTPVPPAEVCGLYSFAGVEPDRYTLDISGRGYAPLTVAIQVPPGVPLTQIPVAIAARPNTVGGTVLGQQGSGAPAAVDGAAIRLTSAAAPDFLRETTSDADGAFSVTGVPDGTYSLAVSADGYVATSRAVQVGGGQVLSVEVVLYVEVRQVVVTVTSVQGFDLTGALVRLARVAPDPDTGVDVTTPLPLAAQPVVRTSASASTYSTTFNQAPAGRLVATVSGPSGHYGEYSSAEVSTAATTAPAPVQIPISVDEVRIRISATASGSTAPPTTLGWSITSGPNGNLVTRASGSAGVGAGADTVFLPRGTAYTARSVPVDGWTITPSTVTFGADDRDVVASFALARPLLTTTTTLTAPTAGAVLTRGVPVTLSATVGATSNQNATGLVPGSVTFLLNGTVLDSADLTGSGGTTRTASVTLTPDASWELGAGTITARFDETTTHAGSVSGAVAVTVVAPTTTSLTASDGGTSTGDTLTVPTGTTVTLTATVTPNGAPGQVVFTRTAPTAGAVATVTAEADGTVTTTVTLSAAGEYTFRAAYDPGTAVTHLSSQDTVTVVVEPAP